MCYQSRIINWSFTFHKWTDKSPFIHFLFLLESILSITLFIVLRSINFQRNDEQQLSIIIVKCH